MSSLCCCRGLLSLFGVKGYPIDVVAKVKMDRAKLNRKNANDYSTMTNDKTENNNGSTVKLESHDLSDASSASKTSSQRQGRRPNSRLSNASRRSKRNARSFDDSDSDSSVDSTEENLKHFRKTLRQSKASLGSRATLNSIDSKRSSPGEKLYEDYIGDGRRSGSLPSEYDSPRFLSPSTVHTSPPKRLFQEDDVSRELENRQFAYSQDIEDDEAYIESLRYPDDSPKSYTREDPAVESPIEEPSTSRGSQRDLQRQRALRRSPKTSPSQSIRSKKSLSPTYGSSKWAIDDAESIYREEHIAAGLRLSGDDEVAMAREASKTAERPIGDFEDDDDMSMRTPEPISACGTLDVAIQYSVLEKKLQVTIIEAHDLPSKARGGSSIVQVRSVLLPAKKKKYKTKVQHISTPRFAETFKLTRASPEELKGLALRLRMYGIGKLKDRLIGEAVIRFDELNLIRDPQLTIQLQLEPRTDINRVDSDTSLNIDSKSSSMMSLSHGGNPPEILIGLSYNPPTGRLCVEVVKGSHFRNLAMTKPPDTLVKLSLLNSSCQEMSSSKTTIRRGQPNPVYKETFFFQVALFQLGEVTLMISVYNKRTIKKKEMIGWVAMGRNSSSEPDEQHWQEMKEGRGQQVCRWHTLIDT